MDSLTLGTQCRNCKHVSALKLLYPVTGKEFPRTCERCGENRVGPLQQDALDSMEATFDATRAIAKAEREATSL